MLIWLKKVEHYKLKIHKKWKKQLKNLVILKSKNKGFTNIKDIFQQQIEILITNKASFGKKGFTYFISCNDAKKLDL